VEALQTVPKSGTLLPEIDRAGGKGLMQREDLVARIVGILVFLAGIGILVVTFILTYKVFTLQATALTPRPASPGGPRPAAALGSNAILLLQEIGLLFIMALVGSLVAGRGIQLYFGSATPGAPEKNGLK